MPAVEQLWSYGETGYHSLAAAVVQAALRARGDGQRVPHPRRRAAVAHEVPARSPTGPSICKDFRATLEHVLARTDPQTDLYVFSNLSMDTLDYTGPAVNEGSKGVWLGLGDPVRELPREFRPPVPPPPDVTDVRVFCGGCLVVGAPAVRRAIRDAAARLARASGVRGLAAGRRRPTSRRAPRAAR